MTRSKQIVLAVVGGVLVVVLVALVAVGCTKHSHKKTPTKVATELAVPVTNGVTEQISALQQQVVALQQQAVANEKANETLKQQLQTARTAPKSNAAVMKALDSAQDGSAIVHMWTGEAATLHELSSCKGNVQVERYPQSPMPTTMVDPINALRAEELRKDITDLQEKIEEDQNGISVCGQEARTAMFDGIRRQAERDAKRHEKSIRTLGAELDRKVQELNNLQ